jgi:S-adenosyl-L-methionine hydrolase (adenosine-forming)
MAPRAQPPPPIAILTDFGYRDHYVGVMKGVIAKIAPGAPIIDITHGIPPQSIVAGAIALRESWRFFPPRTIFLVVVDPGVGTERAPIAIETRAGARFVGPDNGILAPAASEAGIKRIVKLSSARHRLPEVSGTFHGRDIFAPAAAWLWRGEPIGKLGTVLRSIRQMEISRPSVSARGIAGTVIYVDGFGNLVTNIERAAVDRLAASFSGRISVRIDGGAAIPILEAYGYARTGASLATFGSMNTLEIAVRDGNAAARFKAGAGASVTVGTKR